jgi:hypothetical protein
MKKKTSDLALILYLIFEQVYPVWKQYKRHVPEYLLEQLDLDGDFPTGLAAACVKRLNRDKHLRKQCERKFGKGFPKS